MHWIAPTEKDAATQNLEKNLWAAVDPLRAHSGIKAVPAKYRTLIPDYIKDYVSLNQFVA